VAALHPRPHGRAVRRAWVLIAIRRSINRPSVELGARQRCPDCDERHHRSLDPSRGGPRRCSAASRRSSRRSSPRFPWRTSTDSEAIGHREIGGANDDRTPSTYDPRGYDLETGLASVGPGWADLVRRAFQGLPEGHTIVQVKETFGSLRIYFEPDETAYESLIDQLAAESLTICEVCGDPDGTALIAIGRGPSATNMP